MAGKKETSILEKTLLREDFRAIAGTNVLKSNPHKYGSFGSDIAGPAYDKAMQSEEIQKMRGEQYAQKKAEYKSLGVAGEPTYPTDAETSYTTLKQINEVMSIAKLGELYDIVKKSGAKLDFNLPNQLKNTSQMDLMKKAMNKEGKIDPKSLSKDDQIAMHMYQTLSDLYDEANVKNILDKNSFAKLNAQGKQIEEYFNPKKKESE